MLFVARCPGCSVVGPAPCPDCVATMVTADDVPVPSGLDGCRALLAYEGAAREVVAQLKYRGARSVAAWLAEGMAGLFDPVEIDLLTWAPTTDRRRRARGFDQAEVLARRIARRCGVACQMTLVRPPGPPQTGRSLIDRRIGPAFRPTVDLGGLRVVVIDDVVTTGATLDAAGRALRQGGAVSILGLAAAHPS